MVISSAVGASPSAGTAAISVVDRFLHGNAVLLVQVIATRDIAENTQHAQVIVEGGHFEIRHGNARRVQRGFEIGLAGVAAAAARSAGHNDEIGLKRNDRLKVEAREITHALHVGRRDVEVVEGEGVVGYAHQRAAGQFPRIRKAAHACDYALRIVHRDFVAHVVGKRVAFKRCSLLLGDGLRIRRGVGC